MPPFRITVAPAWITVGAALSAAVTHMRETWRTWGLVVALIAFIDVVITVVIDRNLTAWIPDPATLQASDITPELVWQVVAAAGILVFVSGIATTIAGWIYSAMAIASLRHVELSTPFVVGGSLRALGASLVIVAGFVFSGVTLVLVVSVMGVLGILAGIAAAIALVYLATRLTFVTYFAFDGKGPGEAISSSWAISKGAVLRTFGWTLLLGFISWMVNLSFSLFTQVLGPTSIPSVLVSSLVTSVLMVLGVDTLVLLYESQRARADAGPGWRPYDPSQSIYTWRAPDPWNPQIPPVPPMPPAEPPEPTAPEPPAEPAEPAEPPAERPPSPWERPS